MDLLIVAKNNSGFYLLPTLFAVNLQLQLVAAVSAPSWKRNTLPKQMSNSEMLSRVCMKFVLLA